MDCKMNTFKKLVLQKLHYYKILNYIRYYDPEKELPDFFETNAKNAFKYRRLAYKRALASLALIVPIILFGLYFEIERDLHQAQSFARIGSILVFWAAFGELWVYRTMSISDNLLKTSYSILNHNRNRVENINQGETLTHKYYLTKMQATTNQKIMRTFTVTSIFIAGIGTVIWGYGDILYHWFTN